MADSIQETIMDDDALENFSEVMQGREPDSESFTALIKLEKNFVAKGMEGLKEGVNEDNYQQLSNRVAKLESQIGRILIKLNIARPDEIIVTSEMPEEK